jgi:hypothetical protein
MLRKFRRERVNHIGIKVIFTICFLFWLRQINYALLRLTRTLAYLVLCMLCVCVFVFVCACVYV